MERQPKVACHPDQVAGFSPTPPFEIGEGALTTSSLSLHEKPPVVGEIRSGKDLGYRNKSHKWKWQPCAHCGKCRWVVLSKGVPVQKFCTDCISFAVSGKRHRRWRGGRYTIHSGYIVRKAPGHPNANRDGYVREHRLVMEKRLGRYLSPEEVVHHVNEDKTDNRIENLQLFANCNLHSKFHMTNK